MSEPIDAHQRDLLPWYAAGMLSEPEREVLALHLQTCASCQRELSQWQAIGTVTQRALQHANPAETTDASWNQLRSLLATEQPSNGKHIRISGDVYMDFEQQPSLATAIAQRHPARRPILSVAAVAMIVILSVVGFVLFTPRHSSVNVGTHHQPGVTPTVAPVAYPNNASLVTPNPAAHTPLSPPKTSTGASNNNGQLQISGETAFFHVGDTINVSFKVQGARANDAISVKWYMNDTDLTPMLKQNNAGCCSKAMIDGKASNVIFMLQVPSPGFGKAAIYYNNILAYTVVFDVETSAQSVTPTVTSTARY